MMGEVRMLQQLLILDMDNKVTFLWPITTRITFYT